MIQQAKVPVYGGPEDGAVQEITGPLPPLIKFFYGSWTATYSLERLKVGGTPHVRYHYRYRDSEYYLPAEGGAEDGDS